MKRTKKAAALMLALLIAMSMMLPAFAAGSISVFNGIKVATKDYDVTNGAENTTGTITISGVHVGDHDHATVYKVYKMLHLESFTAGGAGVEDAYSYLVMKDWVKFFKEDPVATQYVSFRNNDYVYWNGGEAEKDLIAFSSAALEYAKANGIAPVMTSETPFNDPDNNAIDPTKPHAETYPNQNETGYLLDTTAATGVFHGLSMGYYLIDSNVGSLCGLTTTNPAATVQAKNGAPTVVKRVEEDGDAGSGTASWGSENSASVGETIRFDVTIDAWSGAETYIFHDKMDEGFDFTDVVDSTDPMNNTIRVYFYDPDEPSVDGTNPKLLTRDTDYTVASATPGAYINCSKHTGEQCTFEISFTESFLDTLETGHKIYIVYSAALNEKAFTDDDGDADKEGNENRSWLSYGENHHTVESTTTTYTYGFDLAKTNSADTLLDGAEFELYPSVACNASEKMVFVVAETDAHGKPRAYRLATAEEAATSAAKTTLVVTNGMIKIYGLDNGHYYLKETKQPQGYNILKDPVTVTIKDSYRKTTIDTAQNKVTGGTGIKVVNNTGAALPSTGGMGTTLFIVFGTIAVLGTGMLLVTKKRMGMIRD